MEHVVEHNLDEATARRAAEKAYESYRVRFAEYSPTANWATDTHCDVTFTVKKVRLEGTIDLKPKRILMDLDVPLLFRPFKKLALGYVEGEIKKWIEKAERGELEAAPTEASVDDASADEVSPESDVG